MEKEKIKPPITGIAYGEIAYWLTIVGMIVAITGTAIYLTGTSLLDAGCTLNLLWKGKSIHEILKECGSIEELSGHWYFGYLPKGDAIAMLGIAICSMAAVIGMWVAFGLTIKERDYKYALFALIVVLILTMCVTGIIAFKH